MNLIETCEEQVRAVSDWFDQLAVDHPRLPATSAAANDDSLEQITPKIA
jgi:tRNA-dihydrouridine synthase B